MTKEALKYLEQYVDRYNYLTRDSNGEIDLWLEKPILRGDIWASKLIRIVDFSNSYLYKLPYEDWQIFKDLDTETCYELKFYKDLIKQVSNGKYDTKEEKPIYTFEGEITKIDINEKNRIVKLYFNDGTYTKAKCHKEDIFNVEVGFSLALTRKLFGSRSKVRKYIESLPKIMYVNRPNILGNTTLKNGKLNHPIPNTLKNGNGEIDVETNMKSINVTKVGLDYNEKFRIFVIEKGKGLLYSSDIDYYIANENELYFISSLDNKPRLSKYSPKDLINHVLEKKVEIYKVENYGMEKGDSKISIPKKWGKILEDELNNRNEIRKADKSQKEQFNLEEELKRLGIANGEWFMVSKMQKYEDLVYGEIYPYYIKEDKMYFTNSSTLFKSELSPTDLVMDIINNKIKIALVK